MAGAAYDCQSNGWKKMKKKERWSAFYVRRGQVSALPSSGSNEGAAEVAAVASSLSVSSKSVTSIHIPTFIYITI